MKSNFVALNKSLADVAPGKWFLGSSVREKHLGVAVRPNPHGPGIMAGWVELVRFSPGPSLISRLREVERGRAPRVLELGGIELDVPFDPTGIHPDATRADANELWKPGALVISTEGYSVVIADKDDDLATLSLTDGSLNWEWAGPAALVSKWRLVQKADDEVRELCIVEVKPGK